VTDPDGLASVVERQHGGKATFCAVAQVVDRHKGAVVWASDVCVFDVDHTEAKSACAWTDPVPGSLRFRYFAALGKPPANSASHTVKGAIASR